MVTEQQAEIEQAYEENEWLQYDADMDHLKRRISRTSYIAYGTGVVALLALYGVSIQLKAVRKLAGDISTIASAIGATMSEAAVVATAPPVPTPQRRVTEEPMSERPADIIPISQPSTVHMPLVPRAEAPVTEALTEDVANPVEHGATEVPESVRRALEAEGGKLGEVDRGEVPER